MITTENTTDAWKKAMKEILENGDMIKGERDSYIELRNLNVKILKPSSDIIGILRKLSSYPQWVYPSLSEIKNVIFSKNETKDYLYSYGQRIFNFGKSLNQIDDFIIPLLKNTPNTRRAYISLVEPSKDDVLDAKYMVGVVGLYFRIVNNKLEITVIIRSNNMFKGWPANVYQMLLLQEYVAEQIKKEIGSLSIISLSAHLLTDDLQYVKEILNE